MKHLEVSCAVRRFFKSLGFKGLTWVYSTLWIVLVNGGRIIYKQ